VEKDETNEPYAVTLVGFRSDLILRPLLLQAPFVNSLLLMHTSHPKSMDTNIKVKGSLDSMGIGWMEHEIHDVFNYYEIFYTVRHYHESLGAPSWINTTAGPGIGSAALALYAAIYDISLISYDQESDTIRQYPPSALKDLEKNSEKHRQLLSILSERSGIGMGDLAEAAGVSKPTISRNISNLRRLELVRVSGIGKRNVPFSIELTEWGHRFLEYSRRVDE